MRVRVRAVCGAVALEFVVDQRPGTFATLWALVMSARARSVWSMGSWWAAEVVCGVEGQSRALRLVIQVIQYTGDTAQVVAVLGHHGPLVMTPASDLGETVLSGVNLVAQLMHLPCQVIKLGQLGIDVHHLVVVAVGLGLVDGVDAGHGRITLDVGDPNRGHLLEADSESDVLNGAAVYKVDIEA